MLPNERRNMNVQIQHNLTRIESRMLLMPNLRARAASARCTKCGSAAADSHSIIIPHGAQKITWAAHHLSYGTFGTSSTKEDTQIRSRSLTCSSHATAYLETWQHAS